MMHTAAVQVRHLRVRRARTWVFDGLGLDVGAGGITGLLGPSGSGKTTLMRAIVGSQRVAHGSVTVLGEPAGSSALRRRVSYATQSAAVYDDLTVAQNLRYLATLVGAPSGDVDRVLDAVELTSFAARRVERLSGGQRERVSLAMAMLGTPELIVLDEPTVGLDPLLRASLWDAFRRLADGGTTLLVSSHVMDEAMRCDDVVLLRDGRLVAQLSPSDLLTSTGTTNADDAFLALVSRGSDRRTS